MNYAEFKTYIATFLWRQSDTDLLASLDSLILMATSRLDRDLQIRRRVTTAALSLTSDELELPTDFKQLITVGSDDLQAFSMSSREQLNNLASGYSSYPDILPVYVFEGTSLFFLTTASVEAPITVNVTYRTKLPDFAVEDASWVADDMLDVYTYAVLVNAEPFLRNDERVAGMAQLYKEALNSILDDDAFNGGLPSNLSQPMYNVITRTRRS
jgi:hypothetical protein